MTKFKCNLIIPGFGKSGTSSLHEYLDLHPNICMSKPKETHFFAIDKQYGKGSDFHNRIFEGCGEKSVMYYGESSTIHCLWKPALTRIKNDLDNPKIILILREPVERLLSHYNWLWALTLEKRSLLKAVAEEEKNGFHPDINLKGNYPSYILSSNYSYWCPLIVSLFEKDNVLFLDSKELFSAKEKTMKKCFEFLKIENIDIENEIHKNKTGVQGIQRTFGLPQILKYIPNSIKNICDPDRKIKKLIYNLFGKKRKKSKPVVKEKDILKIKKLLRKDMEFYNKVFSK